MPTKSSLSLTVKGLYTKTKVSTLPGKGRIRRFVLNEQKIEEGTKEFNRVKGYIEKLSKYVSETFLKHDYVIESKNNFPTAAGFASSASGFAALAKALLLEMSKEHSFAEEILRDERKLSAVARLGSGSAARSISKGGKIWWRGWDSESFDPLWDSYAETVRVKEGLTLYYVKISSGRKKISSREGMKRSMFTSPFYWSWVEMDERSIRYDIRLLEQGKWEELFERIMKHSDELHAICRSSYPPIEYLTNRSFEIMERIHRINKEYGILVAYTFDAGPNAVLFTTKDGESVVEREVLKDYEYYKTEPI